MNPVKRNMNNSSEDRDGEINNALSSVINVEALHKEIETKQRELEEKKREIFVIKQKFDRLRLEHDKIYENSPAGYFTFNSKGIISSLNQTGANQLKSKKEHLLNKPFLEFVNSEYQHQFITHLESIVKFNSRHSCELILERQDKSLFYALLESIPILQDNDETYCITTITDITMFKVSQDALKESEERFKNIANTTPVLMWISDPELLFTFVNKYWEQFTGRTLGQEIGLNWIEGIHPDDLQRFFDEYKTYCNAKKTFEIEYRLRTADGSYKWVINKGVPRFQSDNRFAGYIGSCTDINDQKVIEEKVTRFNEELKSLNASKDKFFSIIAHDLKSPLSGLLGFSEILYEEFDELQDDEKKEFIGHSYQAAKNLMALLENLLEWSRMQIGSISFSPSELDIDSITTAVLDLFAQNARSKNIKLEKRIDSGIKAFADKNMFKTVLRNLISNGIKFTKDGGTITVSANVQTGYVSISVRDSGVGIGEENLRKLFKIDSGFSTLGTNKERGTGLGLMLCKELVNKNGGDIHAESELGKGTKFIFTLPKA